MSRTLSIKQQKMNLNDQFEANENSIKLTSSLKDDLILSLNDLTSYLIEKAFSLKSSETAAKEELKRKIFKNNELINRIICIQAAKEEPAKKSIKNKETQAISIGSDELIKKLIEKIETSSSDLTKQNGKHSIQHIATITKIL